MFNNTHLPQSEVHGAQADSPAEDPRDASVLAPRFSRLALCVTAASALTLGVVGTLAYGVWFEHDQQAYADAIAGARQSLGMPAAGGLPVEQVVSAQAEMSPVLANTSATGAAHASPDSIDQSQQSQQLENGSNQAAVWSGQVARAPAAAITPAGLGDTRLTPPAASTASASTAPSLHSTRRATGSSDSSEPQSATSRTVKETRTGQQERRAPAVNAQQSAQQSAQQARARVQNRTRAIKARCSRGWGCSSGASATGSMAAQTRNSKISTPIRERTRQFPSAHRGSAPAMRVRPGPTTVAVASLLCLLVGLVYLATQIRMVFSDQLKQEYAGLVLETVERAESARDQLRVWQQLAVDQPPDAQGYRDARAELGRRLASLAALVNANPSAVPHVVPSALSANASLADTDALLSKASAYWRAQRDADSADVRVRTIHIARTLIALAALLFCMLITAVGMYVKRNRQLAGQSHEFERASLHDPMTGLPNRRKLLAALEEAATPPRGPPAIHKIAVLYIDLDGFKHVNDSLGHRAGDDFLIALSARFRESLRKADVVARIGGDEFAVLIRAFSTEEELAEIARRLIACVVHTDEQMGIGHVRASIGIASFPDLVDDYRRLVAAADDAMYHVKRSGKNGYAFVAAAG